MASADTEALGYISEFRESNPDFDLLHGNLFNKHSEPNLTGLPAEPALAAVKLFQRLLRVNPNGYIARQLLDHGYSSANHIASVPEWQFLRDTEDIFGGDRAAAQATYRKASTIKAQTIHLWAGVHGLSIPSRSPQLRGNSVPESVLNFFADLPSYPELFDSPDYCECEHCKSIFGPAAYFVDLMRIIDRYITKPNESTIPSDLTFESRRGGLFTLPLTCANTNDAIPYIQIVNDVLEARTALELKTSNVLHALALAEYPFNLPANVLLAEIRLYLQTVQTSLFEIYSTFSETQTSAEIAAEYLGLSPEQLTLVTTPTPDEKRLQTLYGIGQASLSVLSEEPIFVLQTGLSREELATLLVEDLSVAEQAAKLPHQFFFNQPLPPGEFVAITTPPEGPRRLTHLDLNTLDRLDRFVRLSKWTQIPFATLDWLLHSLGASEINLGAIAGLAGAQQVCSILKLAPDSAASLWSDMKTTGVGNGQYAADLFDRVFNSPFLLAGKPPYHPLYGQNPLFKDPVDTWRILGPEDLGAGFGRARLLAALGVSDDELTAIGEGLFGPGAEVKLDVANLSRLYRTRLLLTALQTSFRHFQRALSILDLGAETYSPQDVLLLHEFFAWLRSSRISIPELDYILTGRETHGIPPATAGAPYSAMRTIWILAQPGLIQPISFVADLIDEEKSQEAFKRIVENKPEKILVSVRAAYESVFGEVVNSDIAMVPAPVNAVGLAFLKQHDFTDDQITIIASVLTVAYSAEIDLLKGQLSVLFSTTPDVVSGFADYISNAVAMAPEIQTLLTPVRQCTDAAGGAGQKCQDTEEWGKVLRVLKTVERAVFASAELGIDGALFRTLGKIPAAFELDSVLTPSLAAVRAVLKLQDLVSAFGATEEQFLVYLALPSDQSCEDGTKSRALAGLTGWDPVQICQVVKYLKAGPAVYDTVTGISQLKTCFDLLSRMVMDASFVEHFVALRGLPAKSDADWDKYALTARAVASFSNAKNSATFAEVSQNVTSALNQIKRDALLWILLWKLREKYPDFTSPNDLYQFLLIDVEMSGCNQASLILEGLNAAQLYLQRCRLNLEPGVLVVPIPHRWWEWMMNYRVWEANRRIFLYPENYLVPSLRRSKTPLFKKLEDNLQQNRVSDETVQATYRIYMDGLVNLATLTAVDAYRCMVEKQDGSSVDTLFLFSRTRTEPYSYYYNSKEGDKDWNEWKAIDLTINSEYLTPVHAFDRLFVFWVELKQVERSQIAADGNSSSSKNEASYRATIRYSFYDFTGSWIPPQTLTEDLVAFVTPAETTPFDSLQAGYELFDTSNLYWNKVSALRVGPVNLVGAPQNTSNSEKIAVTYGPFLNNNVAGNKVPAPNRPDTKLRTQDPSRYQFEVILYNGALVVNQAVAAPLRGPQPLERPLTLNADLNPDFLLRGTEYFLTPDNRAAGIPAAFVPRMDVRFGSLGILPCYNLVLANYYGDYTSNIATTTQPRPAKTNSFLASGINDAGSNQVFVDLQGNGVLEDDGAVSRRFSLNTDLKFLFSGEPPASKAALIAVVQEILLVLRATGNKANSLSFRLDQITPPMSETVFAALVQHGIIDAVIEELGFVTPTLTSSTDLSFLFVETAPEQKALLISEVRRILFECLGDPTLLANTATQNAGPIVVKNQPNQFIFNNGDEAFLIEAERSNIPSLSDAMQVVNVASQAVVYTDSFITEDINYDGSKQVFADLLGFGIIDEQGRLSPSFGPRTDLSFLFAGEPEPMKAVLIDEVRRILLDLPSLTGLRYYHEDDGIFINQESFASPEIDRQRSARIVERLKGAGIVGEDGAVNPHFNAAVDLEFLAPEIAGPHESLLLQDIRHTLISFQADAWQRTVHDYCFRFTRLTTGAVPKLSRRLLSGGIDGLLNLDSQQIPVVPQLPFSRYAPAGNVTPPRLFDGAQVDFKGAYGVYYWELFFFTIQLIAVRLCSERRFEEAQRWYQFIFNPTAAAQPLQPNAFLTLDISAAESTQAFDQLRSQEIITPDGAVARTFDANTDLSFLWPQIFPGAVKDLMIREVRNVLLNARLSNPSAHYWRFAPFRDHRQETLLEILTDPVAIAAYNDDPFDPYAIARLRIGAFEKGIFMGYLDNLIAWGDFLFAQYTWESLTSATMLYVYAQDLLGPRPIAVGPCRAQPTTNFSAIREKYQGAPGGIPQFLIDMENTLPPNSVVAHEMLGEAFNEIDAYFCVPQNSQLLGYWSTVEDRLFKLRHCLDLEGKPRQLALFQPPLNPLDLVRAAAAGQSGLSVAEQQQPSVPPYRFTAMLQHARGMVISVVQLGNGMLNALDQRDIEVLARLRATQELAVLNMTTQSKTQQVEFAQRTFESLLESSRAIEMRKQYYTGLVREFLSPAEIVNLVAAAVAMRFRMISGGLQAASAIAFGIPQAGSPFAMTYGGIQVGSILQASGQVMETYATISDFVAQTALTMAGYLRRAQDWQFQADQATVEAAQLQKQLAAAQLNVQMAKHELEIHQLNIQQSKAMQEFLFNKFDTQELYDWMANRLSILYFQAYRLAIDAALGAQSAYRFETGRETNFINFDYWDNSRRGLLAGESLDVSLSQMERAFYQNNSRRLEIVKLISLLRIAPAELQRLKTTGECTIPVGELLFDFDFPGQYLRQIKSVQVTLFSDETTLPELHAVLTQNRNDVVLTPSKEAVEYLLFGGPEAPRTIRRNWQSRQQVAISRGSTETGLFEFFYSDERYLPFEGTGAVSEWTFRMPLETNRLDYDLITDLRLNLEYTAYDGGDGFRKDVTGLLAGDLFSGTIFLDLKLYFSEAWNHFMADQENPDIQSMTFPVTPTRVPANLKRVLLKAVDLSLTVPEGFQMPADSQFLSLTVGAQAPRQVGLQGVYGHLEVNPPVPRNEFVDNWILTVDLAAMRTNPQLSLLLFDGFLDPEVFRDAALILEYQACAFLCSDAQTSTHSKRR